MAKEEVRVDDWGFADEDKAEANWFKFEKVGDRVAGEVMDVTQKPGQGTLPAQRVFVLKKNDGEIVNVGISMNKDYVIQRTNRVAVGDRLGFEFTKEVPSTLGKGYAPAKSIEVYWKAVEKTEELDFN
jgi:hypothetical protein